MKEYSIFKIVRRGRKEYALKIGSVFCKSWESAVRIAQRQIGHPFAVVEVLEN